jgi:hypothetical protein
MQVGPERKTKVLRGRTEQERKDKDEYVNKKQVIRGRKGGILLGEGVSLRGGGREGGREKRREGKKKAGR